jgi:predicted site-specific integrase-resolvase
MLKSEKPLSPRKIAEFCQVNFKTVFRWITDGKLQTDIDSTSPFPERKDTK